MSTRSTANDGMSIRKYQRLCRLQAALERIETDKIVALAQEVGYKSKKDFYRAFLATADLTPGAFRRLSRCDAELVRDSIQHAFVAVRQHA